MQDQELAGRWNRLGAVLIDAALLIVPDVAVSLPSTPEALRLAGALVGFAILVWQIVWLTTRGQTVGKRALGLRIVRRDTLVNGGFVTNVILRSFVNGLLCLIPFYFLVDSLLIFRADRRCLHDLIAGTCVVSGQPEDAAAVPAPAPAAGA
ncbi:MAG: RDD family protein [Elusimicrobia bacterium]|nr:RDD family protein [Elusimicrobiota bacterium]